MITSIFFKIISQHCKILQNVNHKQYEGETILLGQEELAYGT